ncbi:MAG: IS66 family insertion sequence element accessory protein TnpB [Dechloromonas sp.]|nr:IS66 family insertion sequence element accessory protein TnpB [Candidatus Dechloromonas phosphoritropha]MBL0354873.1 IS66 family insertion sequence element accessory protein TnpB [Candidatus Dechloromonas phosphoritropha]
MAKAGEGSRVRRSASEWEALLSRFPGSGLNVATFCKREGISDTSFHRWRTRLGIALDSQDKASGQPATFVVTGNYAASSAPTSATRTKASAAGSERTVLSRPVA